MDSYLNLTGHHCFDLPLLENGIVNIPASRFFRPFNPKLKHINGLRLARIRNSLTYAAKNGKCFHLWWHPHNFGKNLEENLYCLENILLHFEQLREEYGIKSCSMKEMAQELIVEYAG